MFFFPFLFLFLSPSFSFPSFSLSTEKRRWNRERSAARSYRRKCWIAWFIRIRSWKLNTCFNIIKSLFTTKISTLGLWSSLPLFSFLPFSFRLSFPLSLKFLHSLLKFCLRNIKLSILSSPPLLSSFTSNSPLALFLSKFHKKPSFQYARNAWTFTNKKSFSFLIDLHCFTFSLSLSPPLPLGFLFPLGNHKQKNIYSLTFASCLPLPFPFSFSLIYFFFIFFLLFAIFWLFAIFFSSYLLVEIFLCFLSLAHIFSSFSPSFLYILVLYIGPSRLSVANISPFFHLFIYFSSFWFF